MTILVTGAAGFLGRRLIDALLADPTASGIAMRIVAADLTPCPIDDPRIVARAGSIADRSFIDAIVEADTALSETTQTSADRAPSPIETARASGSSAILQKPPGRMVQPWGVAAANNRSTNGRGVIRPCSHTGVVDSRTSSWPT